MVRLPVWRDFQIIPVGWVKSCHTIRAQRPYLVIGWSTVHSYNKDITEAIKQFMTAVKIAKEVDMKTEVVNEYNYALLMALKKDRLTYEPILNEAFEYGYSFSDEDLKIINLSFIASTYLDKTYSLDSSKRDEISKRMSDLYGEDWQLSTKELAAKLDAEYSLRNQK